MTKFYKNQMEGRPLNRVSERTRKATMDKSISARASLEWIEADTDQRIRDISHEIAKKEVLPLVKPAIPIATTVKSRLPTQERVECLACHKPAVRYRGRQRKDGGRAIIYEHIDEPPIGTAKNRRGKQAYRYRRCFAGFSHDFNKLLLSIREIDSRSHSHYIQEPGQEEEYIINEPPPSNMISSVSVDPEGEQREE